MDNNQMPITLPLIKPFKVVAKVFPSTEFVLYFDGCSKGNPGPAGIGAVIYKKDEEVWCSCSFIGYKKTNNEAEYRALILGLEAAIDQNIKSLSVCGDSLLVINQVNNIYKVKNSNLYELYEKVTTLKKQFEYIDFSHVYRSENKRADQLSNMGLDFGNNRDEELEKSNYIIEETKDWEEEKVIEKLLNKKLKFQKSDT
jgi:ribonuclease HI